MAMVSGKANPMKLFSSGKLKISGDLMASQKLDFLTKIDKNAVAAAMADRRSPAAPSPATPSPAPAKAPKAPAIFQALADRFASNPALAAELGGTVQFTITGIDRSWVVDGATVREGTASNAQAFFVLSDESLAALASGTVTAQRLFQRGELRVDGDVRLAHRLGILNQLA